MFPFRKAGTNFAQLADFARCAPHEDAIFSLLPLNDSANEILLHQNNRWLVSTIIDSRGRNSMSYGLNIGPFIQPQSTSELADFGRAGDIIVEGDDISRCHFSFERVHNAKHNTTAVMLRDRSACMSTQTFGPKAIQFEAGRFPRRVMVSGNANLTFGFGGEACSRFKFQLVWHENARQLPQLSSSHIETPFWASTVVKTAPVTVQPARIHTPARDCRIRWLQKTVLGEGSFGKVWSAWNVDSGELFAVKVVQATCDGELQSLKREVETLARVSHPHIVEYIAAQSASNRTYEICTELKDGNVAQLMADGRMTGQIILDMFHEMLQALDYLAAQDIIHRDVKPANILFTRLLPDRPKYIFQLADFGISNVVSNANTFCGSLLYMAPEVSSRAHPQTSKIDIWSLLVTILYVHNAGNIVTWAIKPSSCDEASILVRQIVKDKHFEKVQDMAELNPDRRPSAADLLDRMYEGRGKAIFRGDGKPTSGKTSTDVTMENNDLACQARQKFVKVPDVQRQKVGLARQNDVDGAPAKAQKLAARPPIKPSQRPVDDTPRQLRARKNVINYAV